MKAGTIIYWVIPALKSFRRNKRKENQSSRIILERPRLQTSRRNYQPKLLAVKKQRNSIAVEETVIKNQRGEKKSCINKPIFLVDGAKWHKSAFNSLGLDFVHVTFGSRNSVERWFRTVKERTKRFRFVFLFAFWYDFARRHFWFNAPPSDVTEWLQEVMPQLS